MAGDVARRKRKSGDVFLAQVRVRAPRARRAMAARRDVGMTNSEIDQFSAAFDHDELDLP